MKQINDKLYINEDNVQGVQKLGDKYILTTTNGNNLMITESIYNDLKEYEGGGGGGTSYSAGAGIDITDGTISNTYADVIANPTLAGTESDLEGIEIDGTKYKVGGGKQLYQHILFIGGTIGSTYVYGQTLIINDSPLPLVKPSDYVEGTNQKLSKWLYDNDFKDGADSANAYNFFTQYISSANRFGLFSTDGDELKVWKGTSGGFTAEALTPTDIRDKVKPL